MMKFSTIFPFAAAIAVSLGILTGSFTHFDLRRERHAAARKTAIDHSNRRGDIYFNDNQLLVTSRVVRNDDGSELSWREITPEFTPLSNIIGTFTGGIDDTFNSLLREDNPTPNENAQGRSLTLTLSEQTLDVYEVLTGDEITAAVAVLAPDGAVTCLCSTPSFDQEAFRSDERYRTDLIHTDALRNLTLETIDVPREVFAPCLQAYGATDTAQANRVYRDELYMTELAWDLGTLESSYDGELHCSIIQTAAVLSALTHDGTVFRPYLIRQVQDTVTHEVIEEASPCGIGTIQNAGMICQPANAVLETTDGWLCYAYVDDKTVVVHIMDTVYDGLQTWEDASECFERILAEVRRM